MVSHINGRKIPEMFENRVLSMGLKGGGDKKRKKNTEKPGPS